MSVTLFKCPHCGGAIKIYEECGICLECNTSYSIHEGVINFVNEELSSAVEQTTEAFGWQWNHTMYGHTTGSIHYGEDLFFSRYHLSKEELITLIQGKIVLDPAVGSGRVEHIFGKYPKLVYANDLSNAIYAAKKNLSAFGFDNIVYLRSDMQTLPFEDDFFDVVICHATLQHVENPKRALESLLSKVKKGGVVLFDLYKKAAPIRDYCDDFIRQKISDLQPKQAYEEVLKLSKLGQSLREQNVTITIPCDIPFLEIEAGEYDLQRFFYYKILKMFWNDGMSLEENHTVNFDWYYPKISPRFSEEEVHSMLKDLNVDVIDFKATEGGIGVIIQKR